MMVEVAQTLQRSSEIYRLFKYYDDEIGLDPVLSRVNLEHASAVEMYGLLFGRFPESLTIAIGNEDYDPIEAFRGGLSSEEFQTHSINMLPESFPEKKRVLFVHVPKCGGTYVEHVLHEHFPSVPLKTVQARHTNAQIFHLELKKFALSIDSHDSIFIGGHVGLNDLLHTRLWRPGDAIFTTIRNPVDVAISYVNYILTMILEDAEVKGAAQVLGSNQWAEKHLHTMGMTSADLMSMSRDKLKDIATLFLFNQDVCRANRITEYLGGGIMENAVLAAVACNLEVVKFDEIDVWLKKWGIAPAKRMNVSSKYLSVEDLSEADLGALQKLNQDDDYLYNLLIETIDAATGVSGICTADLVKKYNTTYSSFCKANNHQSKSFGPEYIQLERKIAPTVFHSEPKTTNTFESNDDRVESSCALESFFWWHSIRLDDGRVTPGVKPLSAMELEFALTFNSINILGKSVLDVGALNGGFTIEAKRRGAARAVGLDHAAWNDPALRGRAAFEIAKQLCNVSIEAVDHNLNDPQLSLAYLGHFDVVLFLGAFDHLLDPLAALREVASVAREVLVLETHIEEIDESRPLMVLCPTDEQACDSSGLWRPNRVCVESLLRLHGFDRVVYAVGSTPSRGVFHAYRQ